MRIITSHKIKLLLPLACEWVEEQERFILSSGTALSISQLQDANLVGVAEPCRIRLLRSREQNERSLNWQDEISRDFLPAFC